MFDLKNDEKSLLEFESTLGKKDLFYFTKFVLENKDLDECHKDLCKFITSKDRRKLVLMPRGSFKSTIVTHSYIIQKLLNNPNERILLISENFNNACKHLSKIKESLESDNFRKTYGDISDKERKWTESEIIIKRDRQSAEPSIMATGIEMVKVGLHFDSIIIDDPQSEQTTTTKDQLQKVINYFKLLSPILEPGGEIVIIMTRWHYDDLAGHIKNALSNTFKIYERKAILNNKNINDEDITDNDLLFPKRLSLEFLKDQYATLGSFFFSTQYLNEPISDELAVFKKEWFKFYTEAPGTVSVFTTVDPAISERQTADYTAIVTIGVDDRNNWYVLDVLRRRLTPKQIIEAIFYIYSNYKPLQIGIETVAFQKALKFFLQEEMRSRNLFLPLRELKTESRISKDMRIRAIQPRFEQGTIYIKETQKQLMDELLYYPKWKNDDIVDALAYQLQIAFPTRPSKAVKSHLYNKRYANVTFAKEEKAATSWLTL